MSVRTFKSSKVRNILKFQRVMKHSQCSTMGIDVYMLFGDAKIEDREETDYDGRCYIREGYGGRQACVSKLLFPEAFEDNFEKGVEYHADSVIDLFIDEGINELRARYPIDDDRFMWALGNWVRFLTFMREQEKCLEKPCTIYISH